MNNKTFYVFRHGETDWNREKRCQGHTDIPLNANGIEQAYALAEQVQNINFDVIFSSDLKRAYQTAEILAKPRAIPLISEARLREACYGQVEGMKYEDILAQFKTLWDGFTSFSKEYETICFPQGETRKKSRERVLGVFQELVMHPEYQIIGISIHGGVLRTLLHHFLPEEHPVISIPNCVLYKVIYDIPSQQFTVDPKPLFP